MKKTLFLSAILATALCSSAFGADHTYEGTNNTNMQLGGYTAEDTVTFKMGETGTTNWFGSAQSTAAKILIEDDATTEDVVEGLNITNGNQSYVTFSGAVSGNGAIQKTGAGTNLNLNFTGDVTAYTGNITFAAGNAFVLRFGSTSNNASDAGTAPTSSATAGVSGTGIITFKNNGNSTLVYNYAASESPVYITNEIQRSNNGQVKVEFRGGASYVLTKNVVGFNSFTLADGSSFKYMGSTQLTLNSAPASASTLEGVITNGTANLKYTGKYGANSGTLKNLRIEGLDANTGDSSITLDGVTGYFASGSTQRNLTLAGNGMTQSDGFNGSNLTFQKLDGSGNYQKTYSGTMNYFMDDATAWTGSFISTAGTANVTFNGNSNADVFAKSAMNLTLKGTNYSDMHIKAFNGNTATVTVQNSTSDVTIEQLINDPSGKTSNGILNVIVETAGHKVIVEEWATVNNITLKNGSSIKLNNHNVGTLTMESGSGTVTSGANIGSGQHGITNLVIGEDATLTLGNVATVTTVTGADGTLTVNKNLTVNGASTIGTLSVSGDSTIMLNNHNVGTLEVTGGSNFLFSNAAVGSANHTMSKVEVADDASLTFGTANTTVGAITLGSGSTITVGDGDNHNYNLTTSGLKVDGNANINADLVVNGGTMIFANNTTLTMGCAVTIGMGDTVTVELTEEMVATIAGGGRVELFTSVDTATLGSHIVFTGTNGAALDKADVYSLQYDEATKTIYATPEPATATLSLLALAALAARRKRH